MKRVWTGATAAVAIACAATLGAQTGTTSSQAGHNNNSTITVTGCLERGTESGSTGATGTTGSTSATSSRSGEWVLKNATMGSGSGSYSSSGSTGSTTSGTTSGTSSSTMSNNGSTYILDGKSDELSKHAGHKIEVTGRLESSSGSMSGTSSGTTGGTTSGTTGSGTTGSTTGSGYGSSSSMSSGQHLRVESVRMISSSCSASQR